MGTDFESAKRSIVQLVAWAREHDLENSRNEATTRLHLIDQIIFNCLGWDREDCTCEDAYEGTYTDYSLGRPMRHLVIEAKKEGIYFDVPAGFDMTTPKLSTVMSLDDNIAAAIRQALGYCQERGIGVGAVCNGHQAVAFMASRHDGVPPLEGRAIVFVSLENMCDNFLDFWNALSKSGIEAFNIYSLLKADQLQPPPAKLSHQLPNYPGFKNRNPFQTELKTLGELFIEDLTKIPQVEDDFLAKCYSSSGALSQYALISKQLLEARYSLLLQKQLEVATLQAVSDKKGVTVELTSDLISAAIKRRVIILLGDVGVGKSIFVRHLIKVAARDVLDKAIVLYIDFGKEPALAQDLQSFVLQRSEAQLRHEYNIDIQNRNFVRGVYHGDLERFSKGIFSDLKKIDENAYRLKELEYLNSRVSDRSGHLRASLEHIMKAHKRQIVIFLDNVDQRPFEFQEQVFLIGQSLAETWPATVFIALRPDTFHHSRTKGSLAAYQPRVFTVSPPRVDEVIARRLAFALEQLTETGRLDSFPQGLSLDSKNLSYYITLLYESFEKSGELMEFIDNLSGGNIRLALDFVNTFVGSGHVNATKIMQTFKESGSYIVPIHEFARAVLYGDHEHYDPATSPIANIFDISLPDGKEHFLTGNLLAFVERTGSMGKLEGFVESRKIYDFCQGLGFLPSQINFSIGLAFKKKLLEPSPLAEDGTSGQAYRITTIGAYTIKRLCTKFTYIDAMIVDTPIVDDNYRKALAHTEYLPERLSRVNSFVQYLDRQWTKMANMTVAWEWPSIRDFLAKDMSRINASRNTALVRRTRRNSPAKS